jgi:prepilin-type N-terminal cleavage/methylation domain-containing protein
MSLIKFKSNAGFTLVEMLLSLMILGMLLAAAALAFNASATNYSQNEAMFKAMNTARQALLRITTEIRTSQRVYWLGETAEQCSLETSAGQNVRYQYNNADNKLYLEAGGNNYVLCDNITDMSFVRSTVILPVVGTVVRNVQISITVSVGDISQTVCTAAVVRRTLE